MIKCCYKWLLLAAIFSGCNSTQSIKVVRVNDASRLSENSFLYALPENVVNVQAKITRNYVKRGPYYKYADKYLGIKNVPVKDSVYWTFSNVGLSDGAQCDVNQYFMVTLSGDKPFAYRQLFDLSKNGLIFDINRIEATNAVSANVTDKNPGYGNILFKELSMNSNIAEENDTLYETVLTDSTFNRIPIIKKSEVIKTFEEKASEAANVIYKIRKRRLKLVSGGYKSLPAGNTLSTCLEELNRIEKEYMALFIGKTITEDHVYHFSYIPQAQKLDEAVDLFYFSHSDGIVDSNTKGRPISLFISSKEKTGRLDTLSRNEPLQLKTKNEIFYRIPDKALIELRDGNTVLASKEIYISQYGVVVRMPLSMLAR